MSTLGKVTIGAVVAGGILISGISWTGEGAVDNIKGNIDNLKNKLTQAIEDNEWLKDQFHLLEGFYTDSVSEANTTISDLKASKLELEGQIAQLTADLQAKQKELDDLHAKNAEKELELEDAKTELQAEIERLEGELTKANQQIAELEVYAQTTDYSMNYEAIDKDAYTAKKLDVIDGEDAQITPIQNHEPVEKKENPNDLISHETLALDASQARLMAEKAQAMASALGVEITGVVVYNGKLAYQVNKFPNFSKNQDLSNFTNIVNTKNSIKKGSLFFTDRTNIHHINGANLWK